MRVIRLDGRDFDSREKLHRVLMQAFGFPDYYGRNLDALADCLSEQQGVSVRFEYPQAMLNSLGNYGLQVIEVFEERAREGQGFSFRLIKKD